MSLKNTVTIWTHFRKGVVDGKAKFVIKLILNLPLSCLLLFIGTEVQKLLHIPGSIVGLMLFPIVTILKLYPNHGQCRSRLLLKTMVFFIPSVVGNYGCCI